LKKILASERFLSLNMSYPGYPSILNLDEFFKEDKLLSQCVVVRNLERQENV